MSKRVYRIKPYLLGEQRVERARSMLNRGKYHLGHGGRNPLAEDPFDHDDPDFEGEETVDCSGFVAWTEGADRFEPGNHPGLSEPNEQDDGVWFSTRTMVRDSGNKKKYRHRRVGRDEPVKPGDVIVYPPYGSKHYGHTGLVASVDDQFEAKRKQRAGWGRHARIIHASTGNGGVCVRESDAMLWEHSGRAYFLRPINPDTGEDL